MDLVWTYSPKLRRPSKKWKIGDDCIQILYKESIKKGKSFGNTWLYTDNDGADKLGHLVDNLVLLPSDFDYYFLDDIKFYTLQHHTGSFCLIDGDVMLNSSINIASDQMGVENIITYKDSYYEPLNEILDSENIQSVVDFWVKDKNTFNLGLVHIPTNFPRYEFIELYQKVKSFYKNNIEPKRKFLEKNICIEMSICTYLFSLFVEHKKIPYIYLNESTIFKHFATQPLKHKFCSDFTSKTVI